MSVLFRAAVPGDAVQQDEQSVVDAPAQGNAESSGAEGGAITQGLSVAEGTAVVDAGRLRSPVPLVAASDLVLPPRMAEQAAAILKGNGVPVETVTIEGDGGHLDGVLAIAKAGPAIQAFLAK